VAGFLVDEHEGVDVRGLPVAPPEQAPSGATYVVGIAAPGARARLSDLLDARGLTALTLIHPRGTIAPETVLGSGSLVMAGAHVSSSVTAGVHVQVHYNATVGHDAQLGDRVTVLPGANVSGSVVLGADSTIGSGAIVLQGRQVGAGAMVGAGAVVTKDVAEGAVVAGVPARELPGR
jgi:sugar O-acyltransferase (sialic acid O-acetyltransferase NeuD family)